MEAPVEWLLAGEPFVEYRTRRDLLDQSETEDAVRAARTAMLADPRVVGLIAGLSEWPGAVIASHRSAGQPFHRLNFLADLGLTVADEGVETIANAVVARQSDEGLFQLPLDIPLQYGGPGKNTWAWALCDAPLLVYALAKMGMTEDPRVVRAVDFLGALVRANGWPCVVSKELGKFRGPGRKDDPCPFATLAMLKALSQFEHLREGPEARTGVEALLVLWEASRTQHPYMFFMGTDFRKLKAPLVWYDLLHVLDVLSQFPFAASDRRMGDMVGTLRAKADTDGRFAPESVWQAWSGWEFGQKKAPSRWVTFLAWRVLRRVGGE
ncbi:MAG: hypothetical protein BWY06_01956 [Candidatus Latescibacteria bacterium ADurb.Bin168]|nr:MAG: hypothetical protein BWY06_01956 [Candidatus Latescibacteria bacterium ADurb.Bin168]